MSGENTHWYGENNVKMTQMYFLRFKKVETLDLARLFPADASSTSHVNKGPAPSQLCQGPWPVGHGHGRAEEEAVLSSSAGNSRVTEILVTGEFPRFLDFG